MQKLTVAAYQGPIIECAPQIAFSKVLEIVSNAAAQHVDILCFPECFLHGYFDNEREARAHSLDLNGSEFTKICEALRSFDVTVLLGLNERKEGKIYNTVVVIDKGRYVGCYRKATTYPPYDYYSLGTDFPLFEKKGIQFGILICFDAKFIEISRIYALKGARILFCPCFNRIPKQDSFLDVLNTRTHFIAHAAANHAWFVTSDITYDSETHTCPGVTSIYSPKGDKISATPSYSEELLVKSISLKSLQEPQRKRVFGWPSVNKHLAQTLLKTTRAYPDLPKNSALSKKTG